MSNEYLSFLKEYHGLLGNTIGASENKIAQIEQDFNVKLPISYKEFLMAYGQESGNLLGSYYMEYPILKENKDDALYAINFDERKLNQDKLVIQDSYFFFGQWQGYNFFFFDCREESENPVVYLLTDKPEIKRYKDSFTDFIRDEGLKPLLNSKNI
jgi:SMI1-KNR4 cell-wall